MKRIALATLASLILTACAAIPAAPTDAAPSGPPLAWGTLGQRIYVDGPQVTPLEVLEDSRCPMMAQCVWAGRVRISARIHLGTGDTLRELTTGEPIQVADGSLELVEVEPPRTSDGTMSSGDYRFGLRFMGGL